jgi:hypothetical protein
LRTAPAERFIRCPASSALRPPKYRNSKTQQNLSVFVAELPESILDPLTVLDSIQRRHRTGQRRSRHGNFLPFLGGEIVMSVTQTIVDDATQPPQEGPIVGVFKVRERPVRGQIRVLQYVLRLNLLTQFSESRPNEHQHTIGV